MKFTKKQLEFIKLKFRSLTSRELFDHLTINYELTHQYTSFRTELYRLGMMKVQMRRWTDEEKQILFDNYKTSGNIEIAEMLSKKGRIFNKKQIEKQIKLSKLKRTPEDLKYIREKHKKAGVYSEGNYRRWEKKKYKEGELKMQVRNNVPTMMIKVDGLFTPYARYRYIQLYGPVPKGFKVYLKDCNPENVDDSNLCIKNSLSAEDRQLYRKNHAKYFLAQKTKHIVKPAAPKIIQEKVAAVPVQNFITVVISDKVRLQVKPGTDVEKLKKQYHQNTADRWKNI